MKVIHKKVRVNHKPNPYKKNLVIQEVHRPCPFLEQQFLKIVLAFYLLKKTALNSERVSISFGNEAVKKI